MAINQTTLSGAVAALDTKIGVTSAANITATTATTQVGLTFLYIEAEMMKVNTVNGTQIGVTRGYNGTVQVAHGASAPVIIGGVTDFPNFTPQVTAFAQAIPGRFSGFSAPVASANTIVATGSQFHVTGTTLIKTITLPANFVEGTIRIVFDGVAAWDATGNIAVAGTPTTAGSLVDFYYDAGTSKWYPSRLA